ncbi:hypothetical protein [Dactylosporangium darangshiense]|uniref:hypothetical protein n=1 Tax=Dactylosporangium darangshiense TaxID=579108 RepID=UPI0031ED178F
MSMEAACLGIEVHSGGVRAVVSWPDATVAVLPRAALGDSAGWPDAGSGGAGVMSDAGRDGVRRDVPLAGPDLVERFRRVRRAALGVAGGVPASVTVVVSPGQGPRQLPMLRHAASIAGLGAVDVVPVPVAVGWHLLAGGVWLAAGASVLVLTMDDGCAAAVLRRTAEGFEVVASVDAGTVAAELADGVAAAGAVLVREVVRRAMVGAQVPSGMFDLVCAVGPDVDAGVGRQLAQVCGVEPMLVAEPELAPVLGAVQRGPVAGWGGQPMGGGAGWRDVAGVALPAVASLGLFAQFVAGGQRYGPREKLESGFLLAPWGVLAFAAVFGLVALAGGLLLAADRSHLADEPDSGGLGWVRGRLEAVALVGAAAGGTVLAAVYALMAASFFDLDIGGLLRWSVLPVLPAAVALAAVAMAMWRHAVPPAKAWADWLRFPLFAVVTAGVGAALIGWDETGVPSLVQPLAWQLYQWMPGGPLTVIGPVGRLGGALVGVAVALLVVRRPLLRLALGLPLAVLVAVVLSWRVTGTVAVGFAVAVAAWWAVRAVVPVLRPLLLRPTAAADGRGAPAAAGDDPQRGPYAGSPAGFPAGARPDADRGGWDGDEAGQR